MNFVDLHSASESDSASQSPSQAMAAHIFQLDTAVTAFVHLVKDMRTSNGDPDLRDKLTLRNNMAKDIMQLAKDTGDKLFLFYGWPLEADTVSLARINEFGDCKLAEDFEGILRTFSLNMGFSSSPSEATSSDQSPSEAEAAVENIVCINYLVSKYRGLAEAIGTFRHRPYHLRKMHKLKIHILRMMRYTSAKIIRLSHSGATVGDLKKMYPLIASPDALLNIDFQPITKMKKIFNNWWKSKDHAADVSKTENIEGAKLAKDLEAAIKIFQQVRHLASKRVSAYLLSLPPHVAAAILGSPDGFEIDIDEQPFLLLQLRPRQKKLLSGKKAKLSETLIQECGSSLRDQLDEMAELVQYHSHIFVLLEEQMVHDDINAKVVASAHIPRHLRLRIYRASTPRRSVSCWRSCWICWMSSCSKPLDYT